MKKKMIDMTRVYIIESPSFEDIFDNRKEGDALSRILNLSQIKNTVYSVSDIETLKLAFEKIIIDVKEVRENIGGIHIHFSLHGNENGIGLSDKTFLNWEKFFLYIKAFNDDLGYIEKNGKFFSPTVLVFSVCDGFHARKIKTFDEEKYSTYTALIGPEKPIEWADSLLAYSIFYHNIIYKSYKPKKALENMNNIIGFDIFKIDKGTGLDDKKL